MPMGPLHIAALAIFLGCGTITAGIHISSDRRPHHKAKHSLNQSSAESNHSASVAKNKYALRRKRKSLPRRGIGVEKDARYRSDDCKTCWMALEDSPRLFVPARADGVGMRAVVLLHAMAIAAYNDMNFGGAMVVKTRNRCHGQNCNHLLLNLFGAQSDLTVSKHFPIDYTFQTISELQNGLNLVPTRNGVHVLLNDALVGNKCRGKGFIGLDRYATPQFLQNLRLQTSLTTWPLRFEAGRPSVALHVRRGDITAKMGRRFTPDSYYFTMVEIVRKYLPNADIHVFSTTNVNWEDTSFNGYRERNMTVHLDGDVLTDWSHMMQADVFIMGKSSFSFAPAFINDKCIVYQDFCYEPLRGWIRGRSVLHKQESLLEGCLKAKQIK